MSFCRVLFLICALTACATVSPRGPASATYATTVEEINTQSAARVLSSPRHAPVLELQGHATDVVVLQLHGLYESPFYQKGLRRDFTSRGYNVFAPTLARHWAVPLDDLDNVRFGEWERQAVEAATLARGLGKKVIVAGHSLGGLLAVHLAINHPDLVDGLLLWSPALLETRKVYYASLAGSATGPIYRLNYNSLAGKPPPDPEKVAYYSPVAGLQVSELADFLTDEFFRSRWSFYLSYEARRQAAYAAIKVPVFLVQPEIDEEVSTDELGVFWNALAVPKARLILPGENHSSTPKDTDDAVPGVQTPNHDFAGMVGALNQFLDANF